jgi:hypothetical protein
MASSVLTVGFSMKRLVPIVAVVALAWSFSSNAHALTINDTGVVGAIGGQLGNNSLDTNLTYAQALLDMGANETDPSNCLLTTSGCYTTSSTDYSGTIDTTTAISGTSTTIDASYDYVLAKYDGPNGGYVLFYLPDYGYTIPEYSYSIWYATAGKKKTPVQDSYALSGWVAFNTVTVCENCNPLPDGGSTVVLLGSALLGLGFLRRRFGNS